MSDNPNKTIEQRGYAKGYAAGQRRADREERERSRDEQKEEFRRQVFLSVLPACFDANGWKQGEKPITTMQARTKLAWDFADEALKGTWF
jgi:hypothetical protein